MRTASLPYWTFRRAAPFSSPRLHLARVYLTHYILYSGYSGYWDPESNDWDNDEKD